MMREDCCLPLLLMGFLLGWVGVAGLSHGQILHTQTGEVIPGTEGITPGPGVDLSGWNTPGHTLEFADLTLKDLTNASFAGSDLAYGNFNSSNLTNANFTSAVIKGANLSDATGLTIDQLYSTASYVDGDLSGIRWGEPLNLTSANFANKILKGAIFDTTALSGANFTGADLTDAGISSLDLTDAIFTSAIINGAALHTVTGFTASQLYSTSSYAASDLSGFKMFYCDLTGWNLANQNLTGASFSFSNLTNVDFSGADLTGADLANTTDATFTGAVIKETTFSSGFTPDQLYSTATYATGDLSGITFHAVNFAGVDLANKNLTNTRYGSATMTGATFQDANLTNAEFIFSNLTNVNFSGANLTNADFSYATLTNADFTGADLRGSTEWSPVASTITHNTILPDGTIQGLNLQADETLIVHNNPLAIIVVADAAFAPTSTLQFLLADDWTSPIGFDPGLTVPLAGTLNLEFAPGLNLRDLMGDTFKVFDWSGVTPAGAFTILSPYRWDLSKLYTTGEVTLVPEPATAILAISGLATWATRRRKQTAW